MIENGFPESQPQVQQPQTAGQAAHKSAGNEIAQAGGTQQQRIVRPLRSPRQNQQQHAERRAQRHEQQRPQPHQPNLRAPGRRTLLGSLLGCALKMIAGWYCWWVLFCSRRGSRGWRDGSWVSGHAMLRNPGWESLDGSSSRMDLVPSAYSTA